MLKNSLTTNYTLFSTFEEMPLSLQKLYNEAKNATKMAYAPYSTFLVGAAVELESGKIVTGSNQENAAYPSGLCAERTALFHIGSTYKEEIKIIAVAAKLEKEIEFKNDISPCGSCRQVMSEYEGKQNKNIAFLMPGKGETFILLDSVNLLLPFSFDKSKLN